MTFFVLCFQTCPMKGRPEDSFMDQFSERFMDHVRQVCTFAKLIPGFKCLHHDDQVTLLKSCVFEVLLVRLAGLFDSQVRNLILLSRIIRQRRWNYGKRRRHMFGRRRPILRTYRQRLKHPRSSIYTALSSCCRHCSATKQRTQQQQQNNSSTLLLLTAAAAVVQGLFRCRFVTIPDVHIMYFNNTL